MNKKFFVGTLAFGIAASFWACGSGEILNPNAGDEIMGLPVDDSTGDNSVSEDPMKPVNCQACFEGAPSSSSKNTPPRSSSSSSINKPNSVSSSSWEINLSSSSEYTYSSRGNERSSSSTTITSSPGSEVGSCRPARETVQKGDTISWSFVPSISATKFLSAKFSWSSEGATPATYDTTGMKGYNYKVKYPESGLKSATLVVSLTGASAYSIPCSPLQVNGEPISCRCTAAGGDVTTDAGVATWTAECASAANIIDYEWDGVSTGAMGSTFQHTFAAKGDSYTPRLKVSNDDNSIETVTCQTLVATDANIPDYEIKTSNDRVDFEKVGEFSVVANLPNGWHNADTKCTLVCQSQHPFALTFDGIEVSGTNYVSIPGEMSVAHTVGGYSIPVKVTSITAGDVVSCGVSW